ncbi:hypothetical protein RA280_39035 [Cupriavidus sp. CV2]|nr:hypothetical protein [Cupriavidus sp. CV2]MDW3687629.1 hypothetical protein [Cupriavidus sp. CV2]
MSTKPEIIMPTDEEDAAINRGIAADPDTFEVSAEGIKEMKRLGQRGRPRAESKSTPRSRSENRDDSVGRPVGR